METRELSFSIDGIKSKLLPLLTKRVFHVTSFQRFESIKNDGLLKTNEDGSLEYNCSENSFGRKRGYVCLYDLREQSDTNIINGLDRWDFLYANPLGDRIVFLFPNQNIIENLIPNETCTSGELCIPYVESWYKGNIPTELISDVLIVNIKDRPEDSYWVKVVTAASS